MNVNDFEALKKKQETLSMAKTRVEMKIESLTKEMKECEDKLKEQGITDLENREVQKEKEQVKKEEGNPEDKPASPETKKQL